VQLLGCLDEYHDFKGNIVFEITNSVTKNCFLVSYNKQSVLSIDREQRRIVVNKNCIIENDF
jgi:ribosomal 30S subunit maturation factor RimM